VGDAGPISRHHQKQRAEVGWGASIPILRSGPAPLAGSLQPSAEVFLLSILRPGPLMPIHDPLLIGAGPDKTLLANAL